MNTGGWIFMLASLALVWGATVVHRLPVVPPVDAQRAERAFDEEVSH